MVYFPVNKFYSLGEPFGFTICNITESKNKK